jgi:hypothetical protein
MFRQYTKCYQHTPGDKPFNKGDLTGFVLGASAPGLVGALLAFLAGFNVAGFAIIGAQFAATIVAVANQWLFHRLVCLGGPKCALGTVANGPKRGELGEFDNDQFLNVRLLPHREGDDYQLKQDGRANPLLLQDPGAKTDTHPANRIYDDGLLGTTLIKPSIPDLPYDPIPLDEDEGNMRSRLHCEAEGNFWQAMKDFAPLLGTMVAVGTGLGAAGGAALGCAIGGFFGPIGCAIGAIIGAIAGALAGGGAAAYVGANVAFNSDPGNVEDANVGDQKLGPIQNGDHVVVFGEHVYDGFHQGWHEFHPLMAVMKLPADDPRQFLEWDPDFPKTGAVPGNRDDMDPAARDLTVDDMQKGLESARFRARAEWLRDLWCGLIHERFDPPTRHAQEQPRHRWTVHPSVDGCDDDPVPPPIN